MLYILIVITILLVPPAVFNIYQMFFLRALKKQHKFEVEKINQLLNSPNLHVVHRREEIGETFN